MAKFPGKSIYQGIAIGPVFVMNAAVPTIEAKTSADPEAEKERFTEARQTALQQLGALYDKTLAETDEETAAIFEVHQMLLEDDDLVDSVVEQIEQGASAEYAVQQVGQNLADQFAAMDDDYFRERAIDMKDITQRVIRNLLDLPDIVVNTPSIIVADDLTPSETIHLGKDLILGFATRQGSSSSHSAILARTMGIPALYQVDINPDWHGKTALLDADEGILLLDPTADELATYESKHKEVLARKAALESLIDEEDVTQDGTTVDLFANIGSVEDAELALANGARGIGLFRSEFLYLDRDHLPTEDEQYNAYRAVLEAMDGKKVVIRTLDIGADKTAAYLNLQEEQNPALGYRAIRICLTEPEIFRTQLRALLRASVHGTLAIMLPMIISLAEIRQTKAILAEVKQELDNEDISYGNPELGIMIETPAAALMADELAKEVDFFSLGTNDLTQYTLAIDRQNERLDTFLDPHHPALLRLIEWTVKSGHDAGIWVGICGELGADPELIETFLRMGIDELSVSPALVLPTRQRIRSLDLTD